MKVLANDLLHLLNGINFDSTDTINITVTPYKVMFTWTEEDTNLVYSLPIKSGIAPASLAVKTYELQSHLLYGLEDIIKSQSIQFNKESDFLVEFDFVAGRRNSVSLSVVDSENMGVKNLPLKEVFDSFKLPRYVLDAEFSSATWETRSHLRLAKYIAENNSKETPVSLEFVNGDDCDRMKIFSGSTDIFLGSVCADCGNGSQFSLLRSPITIDTSAVGKMLAFKLSYLKWAEYIEGSITLRSGDWGDSITTPYKKSGVVDTSRYSPHLFSNKDDGWVKIDTNHLQKQLEAAICSPVTFKESSVAVPIKSISQSDNEIMVEAIDQLNQLTKIGLLELQATALLDSWEIPDPKMIYNNIIQLELGDGYLTITGNDDRKQKIKLKGSNPNAFGNWQGDGKKLIKILSLIEEYDGRLEIIMEHPRLQIQTTSGASILLLGCDLVGIHDIYENETSLDWWEKPIQFISEIEESGLEIDDIFRKKIYQIKQLKRITQKINDWVESLDIDHNNLEEITDLLKGVNTLVAFIPEEEYIPMLDECFLLEEELYRYGGVVGIDLDFLEEIESLREGLSIGLGKVYQYCCELPSLMQYLF